MAFLFGESKIRGDELQKCLAYLQQEYKLKAFQEKEADLYNNAVVKYGNSMTTDSLASKQMCRAANRLSQSASAIHKRRGGMGSIPEAASAMYLLWQVTYSDYSAWASAQYAAIQAVANGMQPDVGRVRELLSQSEKSQHKAESEEKRLLKRLNLNINDISTMLSNTSAAVAVDNWQPKETEEAEQQKSSDYEKEYWDRKTRDAMCGKRPEYWGRVIGATIILGTESALVGVAWGLAIGFDIATGAFWGWVIGGGIVLILSLGISGYAIGGMVMMNGGLGVIAIVVGLVVWLVRTLLG